MGKKARFIIYYGFIALFVVGVLFYIYFDFSSSSSDEHWVRVLNTSSGIVVGDFEVLPPTESELESELETAYLLNINTATKNELIALETIGEVTAKKIIDYRDKYGFYDNINQLFEEKIITQRQFDAIKNEITV